MAAILIRAFRSGKVVESPYLRLALVVVRLILKIIVPGSEWIGGTSHTNRYSKNLNDACVS
jgi:hypothetical protein